MPHIFCERHLLRYAPLQYQNQILIIVRGKRLLPRGYSLLSKRARKMECGSVSFISDSLRWNFGG